MNKYKLRAIWGLIFAKGFWLVTADKNETLDVHGDNISFTSLCIIKRDLEEKIGDIVQQEVAVHQTNKIINNG